MNYYTTCTCNFIKINYFISDGNAANYEINYKNIL